MLSHTYSLLVTLNIRPIYLAGMRLVDEFKVSRLERLCLLGCFDQICTSSNINQGNMSEASQRLSDEIKKVGNCCTGLECDWSVYIYQWVLIILALARTLIRETCLTWVRGYLMRLNRGKCLYRSWFWHMTNITSIICPLLRSLPWFLQNLTISAVFQYLILLFADLWGFTRGNFSSVFLTTNQSR